MRLATVPYSTSKSSLKQRFVHLTNFSVNKKSDAYVKNNGTDTQTEQPAVESKLNLQQLRAEYAKAGVNYDEIFERIKDVLIKTVLSVENPIVTQMGGIKHKNSCFEVYGFDIIIDANFRPWLLEVNVSPSLSSSSPMDKYIKTLLLSDTFYLCGLKMFDRKILEKEKALLSKQRLLGFESSQKNDPDVKGAQCTFTDRQIDRQPVQGKPLVN